MSTPWPAAAPDYVTTRRPGRNVAGGLEPRGADNAMTTPAIWTFLALAAACTAQPPSAKEQLLRTFTEAGLAIDLEAKTVTLRTRMGRPADLIEFPLIHRRGKAHEAMLITETQPSVLNAALLALALQPGSNVSYKEKDPPPTEAEIRAGADWLIVTPPNGPAVWFTAKWTDAAGKVHELPLEDLMLDLTTGEPLEAADWIYIGGRMASPYRGEPPVYVADLEGNLISSCYMEPHNHLVTLRHERARSDQNWWITDQCPSPGTEVALTIHTRKPKLVVEREERLAKERAAGRQPKGPPKELPAPPASGDSPPPVKRGG